MIKPILFTLLCLGLLNAPLSVAGVSILQSGENHLILKAGEETAQRLYDSLKVPAETTGSLKSGQKSQSSVKRYATLDQSFDLVCSGYTYRGLSSFLGLTTNTYTCSANLHLLPQDRSIDNFTISHRLAQEDLDLLYTSFGMYKQFKSRQSEADVMVEVGDINSGVNLSCHLLRGHVDFCQVNMQKPFTAEELGRQMY